MTLKEAALLVDGTVIGDAGIEVFSLSPIESPEKETILYVEKAKYLAKALKSSASALLISFNIANLNANKPIIHVKDGKISFIKLLSHFEKKFSFVEGIHTSVVIGKNSSIGKRVTVMPYSVIANDVVIEDDVIIYPNCFVGSDCYIGKGTILHPNVVIERGSILGKSNIIQSGAVIGADGFGYHDSEGVRHKIAQIGIVQTGDNVELGANTTIDRATIGKTFIGANTKIDNLVQIAHNCTIGSNCYIAGQCGIAGSSHLGDNVILAGQVGIVDHVSLGDNVIVLGQSCVTHSIKSGEIVMGFPAKPVKEARKIIASLSRLPHLIRQVNKIMRHKK